MSPKRSDESREPWSGDAGAGRLFDLVRGACGGQGDLAVRIEAGLRAALGMLAAEPELAHSLTVEPYLAEGEDALVAQQEWIERFAALLRDAAAADPRASRRPVFVAAFLVGGLRFQIARKVLNGEARELLCLLPGTLEAVLAYYCEPGEPRLLARAALAGPT